MKQSISVLHIITSLDVGGAETMLLKLTKALQGSAISSTVLCLRPVGRLGQEMSALGVPVYSLDMKRALPGFGDIARLRRITRTLRPDVIQGWMYHGNLAATVAAGAVSPRAALVWNIRGTSYDLALERFGTRWVIRLGGWLSGVPEAIVHNAATSVAGHRQFLHYRDTHAVVIGNGFDTERFHPNPALRREVRAELGLPEDALVYGHFARWHPMKDHALLIRAMAEVVPHHSNIHCLLAGTGIDPSNEPLVRQIAQHNLASNMHLLGERRDMHRLAAAVDYGILCSGWGEAFPNCIGELMSAEVPCIVSDVGDSGDLVGDTGWVFEPGAEGGLINAILQSALLHSDARRKRGEVARSKIKELYALPIVAAKYADLYLKLSQNNGNNCRFLEVN